MRLISGDIILYSKHEEGQPHKHGVGLLMTLEATQALLSREPVLPRIPTGRFNSKGRKVAPINVEDE
jgi:hypothetical protein